MAFFFFFSFLCFHSFSPSKQDAERRELWVGGVSVGMNYGTPAQPKSRVSRFFFGAKNDEKIFRDGFDLPPFVRKQHQKKTLTRVVINTTTTEARSYSHITLITK